MSTNPITRRGALTRLLVLGAGAAAAVALAAVVQAEALTPIAPTLPDWLANVPAWLLPSLEALGVNAHMVHESRQSEALFWLDMAAKGMPGCWAESREEADRGHEQATQEREARLAEKTRTTAKLVDDERVAVVRFGRLDPNARRRARRWIAKQPVGDMHPLIRLRSGQRYTNSGQAEYDFLDVAKPKGYARGWSANAWAGEVFNDFRQAVGRTRGAALPAIGAYTVLCGHYGFDVPGAATRMAAYPDGRLATYVHEMMA